MAITFDAGQVRRFRGKGVFHHSFQIQSLGDTTAIVFGDCCHEGPNRVSNQHTHTLAELCETDLIEPVIQPIPEPAPELCALGAGSGGAVRCSAGPGERAGTREEHAQRKLVNPSCHDFVAPQAKPVLREPMPGAGGYPDVCLVCRGDKTPCNYVCRPCVAAHPGYGALISAWDALHRKPAAKDIPSPSPKSSADRDVDAADTEAARGGEAAITTWRFVPSRERGPSAVAAAPGIEPWRPTVDDWDLLADAETGWRR